MTRQFQLEWLGGAAGRRFRRRRPPPADLPCETLDMSALPRDEIDEARAVWTNGAFTEYASAAAFSAMALAFLEAEAPVDLSAAAADFAADEMLHVALGSRLGMTLGGAAPYPADLANLAPYTSSTSPKLKAAE